MKNYFYKQKNSVLTFLNEYLNNMQMQIYGIFILFKNTINLLKQIKKLFRLSNLKILHIHVRSH